MDPSGIEWKLTLRVEFNRPCLDPSEKQAARYRNYKVFKESLLCLIEWMIYVFLDLAFYYGHKITYLLTHFFHNNIYNFVFD